MKEIRIALLGNSTLDYLSKVIRERCLRYGIEAQLYNAPYCQYTQEIIEPGSGYNSFAPELSILFLDGSLLLEKWYWGDLKGLTATELSVIAREIFDSLITLLEKMLAASQAKILVHNFRSVYHTRYGIIDNKLPCGLNRLISKLNQMLEAYAATQDRLYVFDYNGAAAYYGSMRCMDPKLYFAAGCVLSFPFAEFLAGEYLRYIMPFKGLNRKCLVLDLDNTLWGGIAGEDGISGIRLDITGPGRCYYEFQRQLLSLHGRGILLAVCSKNNYEDAMEIIEKHHYMLLRKNFFAAMKINWKLKAENILDIARELNIGMDSMVFFDDSPAERELIKAALPQVAVVDVPEDPAKYCQTLSDLVFFESLGLTQEDLDRNSMYQAEKERKDFLAQYSNLEDYLAGLEIQITVGTGSKDTASRISQLTMKTNQFNMTTFRYSPEDINRMLASDGYLVYTCSASDRFGDSGLVGVAIFQLEGDKASIDTFLLSCRVLGRNIEYAFLSETVRLIRAKGIGCIHSVFIKTTKNMANEDFYLKAGFKPTVSEAETQHYELAAEYKINEPDYIKIKTE